MLRSWLIHSPVAIGSLVFADLPNSDLIISVREEPRYIAEGVVDVTTGLASKSPVCAEL
jgi:hypothetical protein